MADSQETQQEAALDLYKSQLSQVEQALQAAGESPDLVQLRNDLQELITLTEEHLLELKKARLLKLLGDAEDDPAEEPISGSERGAHSVPHVTDDQYAQFQAALVPDMRSAATSSSVCLEVSPSNIKVAQHSSEDDDDDDNDENPEDDPHVSNHLSQLVGTKCRAPYSHNYGELHYGNAMIWSVDPPALSDGGDTYKVRVIFINPIHPSMIPCTFFLDDRCRFSEGECRNSHGHLVLVSELKPFEEPDHSKICEGCRCLAKSTDGVWYPATVTDICDDHLVNVQFDALKRQSTVQVEHIVPLDDNSESSDDGFTDDEAAGPSEGNKSSQEVEEDDLPVFLWKPAQTTDKLGAWEAHTKGIGSRLMAKMGYVTGQGLGPLGDGRAEPVPILLLPQGKSLDKIMELKEMSGNADLFNAMKKLEKRQKVLEKKQEEKEQQRQAKQNYGVFGFLNNKLSDKKEHHRNQRSIHPATKETMQQSSELDLSKKSDTEVNVQIFKTAEEIKKVERNLLHLKQQLSRNETRDRKMTEGVKVRIREAETYLSQLKTSSQTLETHKERRTASKKLTVF